MAVGKKPDWYRGAYLVEVLGYCAECHKLRILLVALNSDMHLADAIDGLGGEPIQNITLVLGTGVGE